MASRTAPGQFWFLLAAALPGPAAAAWAINLQPPATAVAREIHDLHNLMLVICGVIFAVVAGFMSYALWAHRKSRGRVAASFHENTRLEIAWTVLPFLVLVGMAWPATTALVAMRDTAEPELTIKATGYQWRWGYDYLRGEGEGIRFVSALATPRPQITGQAPKGEHYLLEVDEPLVVPVGRKVRILTTSSDVIHSWWVPAFGVKQDAIPGFVRDAWFRAEREGVYRGNCAELCGKDHGFMPVVVEVVSPERYGAWVAQRLAAARESADRVFTIDELRARGEKVYAANCAACHQADGRGLPPAFPPLDGSAVVTGPRAAQLETVLHGRPGTAMAAFGKQLSDQDIAAVITYTRNAWGNRTGEAVQPAEIRAARGTGG
ncbi:MAG TPA: cytochrome c oxidase subunit II [Burkholderiales bacterium]|nr:cytochrome c oxidase subunit II [Burkholderiales bacterium]